MTIYDYVLGGLSFMACFATLFLVVTHFIGKRFEKHNDIGMMVKTYDIWMVGFASFISIAIMLSLFGAIYFVRLCYV